MLNFQSILRVVLIAAAAASCQMHHQPENAKQLRGDKINLLHQGDPNLAGIIVYQNDPVNMDGAALRNKGDHPFAIMYYFWNEARVHDVAYDKEGRIVRDIWRTRFTPIPKDEWSRVNFSYGSDPAFERHAEPSALGSVPQNKSSDNE